MYNKTSLFGKLIVGAFTGMLLFTGVQTAHVYANNNSDTEYDFSFDGYNEQKTEKRPKFDDSAAWMGCHSFEGEDDVGYLAYVYGYESYNASAVGESYSIAHKFYEGTEKYMKNWAYEYDHSIICIKATLCSNDAASYGGLWSLDNMSGY